VERVRLHRQIYGTDVGSVLLQSERRGSRQGRGVRHGASDDHEITDTAVILGMREAYLAKAGTDPKNDPVAPQAIWDHFNRVNSTLRMLEKERIDAEPQHLEALLKFAARAYRRR